MADNKDLPEDIEEAVAALDGSLQELDEHLQPLLKESISALQSKLNSEEKAKCELTMAYAIQSLFWMYLTVSGVDPQEHPIKKELERTKEYMRKVKDAVDLANAKGPTTVLDKTVTNRFLRAALNDAEEDTKRQLRELGKKYEQAEANKDTMPSELAEIIKQAQEDAKDAKDATAGKRKTVAGGASEKKKKKQKA